MLSKPYHTELGLGEENGQAYGVETYLSAQANFRSQTRDVRPCRHGGKMRYPCSSCRSLALDHVGIEYDCHGTAHTTTRLPNIEPHPGKSHKKETNKGLLQQAPKPSGRQGGKGKLVSKLSVPRHTQPPKEVLLYTNWTSRHVSCWKILGTFYSFALNFLVSSFCTRSVLERRFSHRGINNFGFSRLPKPPPQNLPMWEISKKMSTAPYRAGLLSCRGEP